MVTVQPPIAHLIATVIVTGMAAYEQALGDAPCSMPTPELLANDFDI
jgi:hypothetical protein